MFAFATKQAFNTFGVHLVGAQAPSAMWYGAAARLLARRHLLSWLFEVLPVALLLLQSTGAHEAILLRPAPFHALPPASGPAGLYFLSASVAFHQIFHHASTFVQRLSPLYK